MGGGRGLADDERGKGREGTNGAIVGGGSKGIIAPIPPRHGSNCIWNERRMGADGYDDVMCEKERERERAYRYVYSCVCVCGGIGGQTMQHKKKNNDDGGQRDEVGARK